MTHIATLSAPVKQRLTNLLKLALSTTNLGERSNACDAVVRTLANAGADIHDLATAIEASAPPLRSERSIDAGLARYILERHGSDYLSDGKPAS